MTRTDDKYTDMSIIFLTLWFEIYFTIALCRVWVAHNHDSPSHADTLLLNNLVARILYPKCHHKVSTTMRTQTSPWVDLTVSVLLVLPAVAHIALGFWAVVALSYPSPFLRRLAFLTLGILSHGSRLLWLFLIDSFVCGSSQSLLHE
ncbi:hypothetical protein V8B97DRAFT_198809 [Scleroderma yunnanense]